MAQKNRRIAAGRHLGILRGMILAAGIMTALWSQKLVSLADSTGTVSVGSAKIREAADTGSAAIGSASQGSTVNIRDEVQDASGTLWYQVYVDANTMGYIRADLVDKKDGGTQSTSGGAQSTGGAAAEAETAMDAQYATVLPEAVKVRSMPSTSGTVVDRLTRDAQVTVTGQSGGTDGKTWYYATFTGSDGTEKTGFIRSDLLTLGDMVPVFEEEPEPEPEEEPEPAPEVNNDYELTYEQGEDGSYEWYLYDYTSGEHGSRQKLQLLLDATKKQDEDTEADAKTLVRQRIVIVALGVLAVVLLILVIVMALKLRDAYYEDYEDEDEDEDDAEDEEEPAGGRRRAQVIEDEPEEALPQRSRRLEEEETLRSARRRTASTREDRRGSVREVEYRDDGAGSVAADVAPKRRAKNFLLDDDDFEFEFLNMDDKGL